MALCLTQSNRLMGGIDENNIHCALGFAERLSIGDGGKVSVSLRPNSAARRSRKPSLCLVAMMTKALHVQVVVQNGRGDPAPV